MARKTYYSKTAALQIFAFKGKLATMADGAKFREGQKPIEFTPMSRGANNSYGWFVTDDPEIQEYLDNRIKELGDIMDAQEFGKLIALPQHPEDKDRRILELQNQLASVLAAQGKLPAEGEKSRATK